MGKNLIRTHLSSMSIRVFAILFFISAQGCQKDSSGRKFADSLKSGAISSATSTSSSTSTTIGNRSMPSASPSASPTPSPSSSPSVSPSPSPSVSTVSNPQCTGQFTANIGSSGYGSGLLMNPFGVTVDRTGNVYVANHYYGGNAAVKVQKYNVAGGFVREFGDDTGAGKITSPIGVAVDSTASRLYIADQGTHRIAIFNSSASAGTSGYIGEIGSSFSGLSTRNIGGIALDTTGANVFLSAQDRILQFDTATGSVVRSAIGTSGITDGRATSLNYPIGLAVDSNGHLLVADTGQTGVTGHQRIVKFNVSDGSYVSSFGTAGAGDIGPAINNPTGVAYDSSGNIYVSDNYDQRAIKFNADGVFIANIGAYGSGPGKFMGAVAVALDSNGNIYFTDSGSNQIAKFSPTSSLSSCTANDMLM